MNELSSALRTQSGSGRVDELTQGCAAYVRLTVYLGRKKVKKAQKWRVENGLSNLFLHVNLFLFHEPWLPLLARVSPPPSFLHFHHCSPNMSAARDPFATPDLSTQPYRDDPLTGSTVCANSPDFA